MFFDRKDKKQKKCENCGSKSDGNSSFCPRCGNSFIDTRKEREDFGLLGRNDSDDEEEMSIQGFGVMDKLVSSMFNSLMKNFNKQFKNQFEELADLDDIQVRASPDGRRIEIFGLLTGPNAKRRRAQPVKTEKRQIAEEQLKRMTSLPRATAKTSVKRLGDRIVYELATPGVTSPQDVFVCKLESGYEIKAIGDKKVYVNSVPINLPLKKYSILNNKLMVEFLAGQNFNGR